MCGIVGALSRQPAISFEKETYSALEKISSRGPDYQGFFGIKDGSLGHRRLSIIDTTSCAHQPMHDDSGRYTIVFNGEIYNFKIIRKELEQKGYTFESSGDTEVLLKGYLEYGEEIIHRLNGFFAFVIYDSKEKSVLAVRDRFGIKPFFYSLNDEGFFFASELKALQCYPINKNIDYNSVAQYLHFNYIPSPHSIFKDVKKLAPGHLMHYKSGELTISQWYSLEKKNSEPFTGTYTEACSRLETLLDQSVQRRMISDVPLGSFLSGGIDSSVIATLARRHTNHLETFSIGYKDNPYFDETHYAIQVANQISTDHTIFKLSDEDLFEHLFQVLDYMDEPFADSSALPVYILSHLTKKKVSVALSGDGADEIFTGYNKHKAEWMILNRGGREELVTALAPLWKALPKSRNNVVFDKIRQLDKFAKSAALSPRERYWLMAGFTTLSVQKKLLKKQINTNESVKRQKEILQYIGKTGTIDDVLRTDLSLVLPGDMLTKVDSMSMANSLEVRVPFLDHDVVEFAFSLPHEYKITSTIRKRILQDTFRDILPDALYNRPKRGFEVPLLQWLQTGLRSLIEDDLLHPTFVEEQGIFNVEETERLKKQLISNNPGDAHARVWGLLVFQYWWKKNIL